MRFANVHQERDLPQVYHDMANATKGERRKVFQRALLARSNEAGAATSMTPVVTKELYEMIINGELGPPPHQLDDLAKGVTPFSCGYIKGTAQATTVEVKAQAYDLTMEGQVAPNLAERDTFRTDAVPLPTSIFQTFQMIKACSLVLDVTQELNAPLAAQTRNFCLVEVPHLVANLQTKFDTDP